MSNINPPFRTQSADEETAAPDPSDLPIFRDAEDPEVERPLSSRHPAAAGSARRRRGKTVSREDLPEEVTTLSWSRVQTFRQQGAQRLADALQASPALREDRKLRRERARAIAQELVNEEAEDRVSKGIDPWGPGLVESYARAVLDAMEGLGRLQHLVDRDDVENIMIIGHDRVWLDLIDGTIEEADPVADSDAELVEFLQFIASRSENARPFNEANPRLHLRLEGNTRLAAAAFVTPRPQVVIRRHRLVRTTLAELAHDKNLMTPVAESFLRAVIKSRRLNLTVAGDQGVGKTTLTRALAGEFDPLERIGTFETEYELLLHEMPDRHPLVFPWESRPGSGELTPDGRRAGEFTLTDAIEDSFRFNLTRQVVGEVRGSEVLVMIRAMGSGMGSVCTTHAWSAEAAIGKLITLVMAAGPQYTREYATSVIVENLQILVHIEMHIERDADGTLRRRRRVSEILHVRPGGADRGWNTTRVFTTRPGEDHAEPNVLPDDLDYLVDYGFDSAAFHEAKPFEDGVAS